MRGRDADTMKRTGKSKAAGKHDWSRLDAMTEAEKHAAALSDHDNRPLTEEDLKRMKRIPRARISRRALGLSQEDFATRYHIPLGTLRDWEQVKLLSVSLDRLETWWRPGLLAIGDAAHAMSPVGGVGINLAIQDAVAAANILWKPLHDGHSSEDDLARVQKRREFPTRVTQAIQVFLQDRVISRALAAKGELEAPLPIRLLARFPILRRIPARLLGLGVRPEHVRTPERVVTQSAA